MGCEGKRTSWIVRATTAVLIYTLDSYYLVSYFGTTEVI